MTNATIKNIVENEMKNMRNDVIAEFHTKRTGIYVFFKAAHHSERTNMTEYAQITGYTFHRIQKSEHIINKLRADNRLYN